ncbi:copper homeostasis membrane protein CopD [Sphingomonas xinjiangensis]|uniref:Putative copper resistance protein D n=1 Tax=Sphingomonas xinjiangensis TaxID=643568 RepID=A0A840YSH3_9SPHN|nr:copper homeostasis membrane protein CopD [Sphingomonas xinjiangensis]MBB5712603.1 putative copper resistance protein D [Sphingomonas xinjiangensis]
MDWPTVAVRFGLYLGLMLAFGLPVFVLTSLRDTGQSLPVRPILLAACTLGLGLSVAGLLLLAASMSGTPVTMVDGEMLSMIFSETGAGTAWIVRIAALVMIFLVATLPERRFSAPLAATAAAVALGSLAWSGHGAMSEGATRWLHLASDVAHLLAAGAWIGALLALVLLVFRPAERIDAAHLRLSHAALHGFARTGTMAVMILVASGLANTWLIVGLPGIADLLVALYGQLLLAKLAVFAAMIVLAAVNRFRLTPALERDLDGVPPHDGMRALRRSLALEIGCAIAILVLVAWLGTLEPLTVGE